MAVGRVLSSRAFIVGIGLVAIFTAIVSGDRHDYVRYLDQWRVVLSGANPWQSGSGNAYGPLFLVFAPLVRIHALAPKVLFVCLWLLLAWWYRSRAEHRGASEREIAIVVGFLLLNPFFWVHFALFGHFDIVVAASMIAAIAQAERGRVVPSGLLLGIGTLMKFYPLVVTPFMARNVRRGALAVVACVGVFGAGLLVAVTLWGGSWTAPLAFASAREPKILSLFATFNAALKVVGYPLDTGVVSLPLVAIGLMVLYIMHVRRLQFEPAAGALTALVVTLALYKVGHSQFHTVLLLLLPHLFLQDRTLLLTSRVAVPAAAYATMLAALDTVYVASGGLYRFPWILVRFGVGLPAFVIMTALVLGLVGTQAKRRATSVPRRTATEE